MASGVRWNETYTDPNSDCRKLLDAQLQHKPGASVDAYESLVKAGPAGTIWNYNSGEINLIGAVIERATGIPLASYFSASLWSRLGMEQDATWWIEAEHGLGLAGVGLSATMGDLVSLFNKMECKWQALPPKGWFQEAGSPHAVGGKLIDHGYLWWPLPFGDPIHSGAFEAQGIFGQRLYINPKEELVIVVLSARPKPTGATVLDDAAFFTAVAKAVH